ncbi:MAG: PIN/TRAM domain-containing protein [Frankiaceae bacterium]
MNGPLRRAPSAVVELLRLAVVIFCAGAGFELSRAVTSSGRGVLGPFNGAAIGIIVGSGLGYALGGALGRSTLTAVDRTESALRAVSAETLVAGGIGLVGGVAGAAAVSWPLLLVHPAYLSIPLLGFVVVVLGALGFRVGMAKRDGVLAVLGGRAGIAPRPPAPAALPRIIDTSVAVDGRVLDVVRAGFLHGELVVAAPVLAELQALADAADDVRRSRGRRGLDTLAALRREPGVELVVLDDTVPQVPEVDGKLVRLCLDRGSALLTLDTNLAKAAALAGVPVLNLHALTLALRPPVTAGDDVSVLLLKPGKEPGQAVGYLDDGTMVVAERSRAHVGEEVTVRVTSVLTTANGRMVFARPALEPEPARGRGIRA